MKRVGNYWMPDEENTPHFLTEFENKGGWQLNKLHLFIDTMKANNAPFKVAIDCGAHVGSWTKVLAENFDHVYAFELNPDTFECLERNITDWGLTNVTLLNKGVGDVNEQVSITKDDIWNECTGSYHVNVGCEGDLDVVPVDSMEIKDASFIKLDVEGYEYRTLVGLKETAKSNPYIMIEYKVKLINRFGGDDPLQLLKSWGYEHAIKKGSDHLYRRG